MTGEGTSDGPPVWTKPLRALATMVGAQVVDQVRQRPPDVVLAEVADGFVLAGWDHRTEFLREGPELFRIVKYSRDLVRSTTRTNSRDVVEVVVLAMVEAAPGRRPRPHPDRQAALVRPVGERGTRAEFGAGQWVESTEPVEGLVRTLGYDVREQDRPGQRSHHVEDVLFDVYPDLFVPPPGVVMLEPHPGRRLVTRDGSTPLALVDLVPWFRPVHRSHGPFLHWFSTVADFVRWAVDGVATVRLTSDVDGWDPVDRLLLATELMGFALRHFTDSMLVDNQARGPWTTLALRFESLDPLVWRWCAPGTGTPLSPGPDTDHVLASPVRDFRHVPGSPEFHVDFHPEPFHRDGAG